MEEEHVDGKGERGVGIREYGRENARYVGMRSSFIRCDKTLSGDTLAPMITINKVSASLSKLCRVTRALSLRAKMVRLVFYSAIPVLTTALPARLTQIH